MIPSCSASEQYEEADLVSLKVKHTSPVTLRFHFPFQNYRWTLTRGTTLGKVLEEEKWMPVSRRETWLHRP